VDDSADRARAARHRDLCNQLEPAANIEPCIRRELGQGLTLDELHRKVRLHAVVVPGGPNVPASSTCAIPGGEAAQDLGLALESLQTCSDRAPVRSTFSATRLRGLSCSAS
jgi:hypothetical protein